MVLCGIRECMFYCHLFDVHIFPQPFPLVSVSRQLERKGTLFRLRVEQKLFNKHHIKKKPVYIFVFTDYIIITKRKKE